MDSYAKQNWKRKEHKPPNEVPALRIDENVKKNVVFNDTEG